MIHRLVAVGGGGAAVEGRGQLQHDVRAAGAAVVEVRRQLRRRPPASSSDLDVDAGGAAGGRGRRRRRWGRGRSTPTTTRPTPAAIRASAHGPVRPWWLHGSRVTATVAPAVVGAGGAGGVEGDDLGVAAAGRLGGAVEDPAVGGDEDGADPGVRRRAGAHAGGVPDRSLHRLAVVHACSVRRSARRWAPASDEAHTHPRSHPDSHRRLRGFHRISQPRGEGSWALTAGRDLHPCPARGRLVLGCLSREV